MRFDRLIKALLPRDDTFFTHFEKSTQYLIDACGLLRRLADSKPQDRPAIADQIHDLEHKCDMVTHQVFASLNATFVTPFDREDVHVLASALDDVMDYLDGSAGRFVLYKIKDCPKDMLNLIEILTSSVKEIHKGVVLVRDLDRPEMLQETLKKVNEYENKADAAFEQAIADLFENEKDPIQVIKLKEIYVGLETATDKCEDAANVLESILIKHA
jgi:hypothetical protein